MSIKLTPRTLLGPKFTKASLGHEPDGLVFQPSDEAYKSGRDDNILKWKPHTHNSVDFKLQVGNVTTVDIAWCAGLGTGRNPRYKRFTL